MFSRKADLNTNLGSPNHQPRASPNSKVSSSRRLIPPNLQNHDILFQLLPRRRLPIPTTSRILAEARRPPLRSKHRLHQRRTPIPLRTAPFICRLPHLPHNSTLQRHRVRSHRFLRKISCNPDPGSAKTGSEKGGGWAAEY